MKYIHLFNTTTDYNTYLDSDEYIEPNVCLCEDSKNIIFLEYIPIDNKTIIFDLVTTEDNEKKYILNYDFITTNDNNIKLKKIIIDNTNIISVTNIEDFVEDNSIVITIQNAGRHEVRLIFNSQLKEMIDYDNGYYDSNILSITMPDSATDIEVINGLDATLILGSNVQTIQYENNSLSLKTIIITTPVPPTILNDYVDKDDPAAMAFKEATELTIYVPDNYVNTYKATNLWKNHEILPMSKLANRKLIYTVVTTTPNEEIALLMKESYIFSAAYGDNLNIDKIIIDNTTIFYESNEDEAFISITIPTPGTHTVLLVFDGEITKLTSEDSFASLYMSTQIVGFTIPDSVTSININGLQSLENITCGSNVSEMMGFDSDSNFPLLTSFTITTLTPPELRGENYWNNDPAIKGNNNLIVYVPTEAVNTYKATNYWKNNNILAIPTT